MRRSDRARGRDFCYSVIDRCSHGVAALSTGTDTPFCLPLSLVRVDDRLYFHCAMSGRKTELLRRCPNICITFVAEDDPCFIPPREYTTFFKSVIASGTAVEVTDDEEKCMALRALCKKLTPVAVSGDSFGLAIKESLAVTSVWRIDIKELSGKEKPRPDAVQEVS